MMPGGSTFGSLDLQGSMRINHHQQQPHGMQHHSQLPQGSMPHQSIHDVFPLTMGHIHDRDQSNTMVDFNKNDRGKNSASDEDEPSFNEEGADGPNEPGKGKKATVWQRVRWTDSMVKLLITAVSYIGEDAVSEHGPGGRRKYANLQKKGKWKSVSKVMAERGYYVSPQQCEDKFNDLNKRYKKLNDILGRGTSCQVVENPALMDMMDHLSDKAKDEVRKILSSKHLFYEEMCSYHNNNRLHLPPDPALQRALQLALRSREDHEPGDSRRHPSDDLDEDDHDSESDDHEEYEENRCRGTYGVTGDVSKRIRLGQGTEDLGFQTAFNSQEFNKNFLQAQNPHGDVNLALSEGPKAAWLQKQWVKSRSVQLQEQKLQLELEMLEIERQRFKWQKFSRKKDSELEKLKMENEKMKLENDRMALDLKRMEMTMKGNEIAAKFSQSELAHKREFSMML